MASYQATKLVQELVRDPDLAERFRADPHAVALERGVADEEARALAEGGEALTRIGLHPVLHIHYNIATDPSFGPRYTIADYADRWKEL